MTRRNNKASIWGLVFLTAMAASGTAQGFHPSSSSSSSSLCAGKARLAGDNHQKHNTRVVLSAENNPREEEKKEKKEFEVKTWNPLRLAVLRMGMTELAWTSPLNYGNKKGIFKCAYCGQALFDDKSKYNSGSGWPSFWRSLDEDSISYKMEFDGRLECRCNKCSSHLGHVFLDGPRPNDVPKALLETSPSSDPRSQRENARLPRFCVNGASLVLEKDDEKP